MRVFFLWVMALVIVQTSAQAESPIETNCAGKVDSFPQEFANFSTESQRRANPSLYVQTMEKMIRNGPFKQLLDCRDQLQADPQFKYNLRFLGENEGLTMSVKRNRKYEGLSARAAIELSFNLKSSPQRTLFVYIHELTHVCQAYRWADLQAKYDIAESLPKIFSGGMLMAPPGFNSNGCSESSAITNLSSAQSRSEVKDNYYRHRKLGEVEAFYNMTKAYEHYTNVDPSFCKNTKDGGENQDEGYLKMEKMINQGYFAQDIIVNYHEDDKINKEEIAAALFDLNSPQRMYPDQVSRPALNPSMLDLIKKAGLPVIEPAPIK